MVQADLCYVARLQCEARVGDMGKIAEVRGIKVGHACDLQGITGITVVLCEDGAVGSAVVVGGAPGTRETDLLRPSYTVQEVHGIFLSGVRRLGSTLPKGL